MPRRTITDEEIALIKALLNRNLQNKNIQFFFNRPDRPVNSGRISTIDKGTYSNSSEIPAASDEVLDNFLASFAPTPISVSISAPMSKAASGVSSPDSSIRSMFELDNGGRWCFCVRETDQYECKEGFGFRHCDKWLKAIAALANNRGGYVVFGICEHFRGEGDEAKRVYDVVGLKTNEFQNIDLVEFTKKLKSIFDPTPSIDVSTVTVGDKTLGVIQVRQHPSRPVIAVRNEGELIKEGDIFFRYTAQSSRIKYSDLRAIFDERDRHARESVLPMVEKLLSLGPKDAMIADLSKGTLADGSRSFVIGEDLLQQIKFIQEGQFEETEGAPTLRLVGNVQAVDSGGRVIQKGVVTASDIMRDFIEQKSPYEPKEYVRFVVEGGNGAWLPIHYYAKKANMTREDLHNFIMSLNAPYTRRQLYAARVSGSHSAFFKTCNGQPAEFLQKMMQGTIPEVHEMYSAASFARAVAGLPKSPKIELNLVLAAIQNCANLIQASSKQSWLSAVRRGVSRIDELFFGEGNWEIELSNSNVPN